jgi:hypothetical protein
MNEWHIQSRSHACQACERSFADQEAYHTLLFDQKHEFIRLDVCGGCWEKQYGQGAQDRKGYVSHWQGVYEAPPATPPEAIQKDTAETLLRKLIELNDPQYAATAYILSAMLERKRLLKVKEQLNREGQRVFVYEHAKTGDLFAIPDPRLQLNQLEQVQRDVAHLLEHGLPQPPAPATEPAPVADAAATGEAPISGGENTPTTPAEPTANPA